MTLQFPTEQRRARADLQRLFKHHTMPEIVAMLCRELDIPPDPALWRSAATLAAGSPSPGSDSDSL